MRYKKNWLFKNMKINVLFWTPPQSFSEAWKKKWLNDERWKLIFDYFDFIKNTNPEFIFFENVPWLLKTTNEKLLNLLKMSLKNYDII